MNEKYLLSIINFRTTLIISCYNEKLDISKDITDFI